MAYVDGFVIPVPETARDAYRKLAEDAAVVFKRHGALEVVECWADDMKHGQWTDFFRAVDAQPGEAIVFAWILWPSREARDEGNRRAMEDLGAMTPDTMPFDGKRMIWGGFTELVRG